MSKTNFNSPFRISGDTDGWGASHDGIGCSEYRAIKDADDFVVALVVDTNEDHAAQLDTKKHADLFAAAPDLLAALQGLDEAYCRAGTPLTREERTEDRKRLIAARAAIAKATGAGE